VNDLYLFVAICAFVGMFVALAVIYAKSQRPDRKMTRESHKQQADVGHGPTDFGGGA